MLFRNCPLSTVDSNYDQVPVHKLIIGRAGDGDPDGDDGDADGEEDGDGEGGESDGE